MRKGFSLIELVVVILIIGIVATIGVPRFLRSSRAGMNTFIAKLNDLVSQGAVDAQQKGEPLRVFFSLSGKKVELQTTTGKPSGGSIPIPDTIDFVDVVINGKSQFLARGEKDFVYFLINQEGISQEVKLMLKDLSRSGGKASYLYEFYLNPFTSVFRLR